MDRDCTTWRTQRKNNEYISTVSEKMEKHKKQQHEKKEENFFHRSRETKRKYNQRKNGSKLPKLGYNNLHFQEAKHIPCRKALRDIIHIQDISTVNSLKTAREKQLLTHKEIPKRLTADFPQK